MSNLVSIESEQAVIGSMLIDSGCIRDVAAVLRETDFALSLNQELFRVITTMDRDGRPVDALTICQEALNQHLGEEKQLKSYLFQLMEITPTAANVMEYADIVAERARKRELNAALEECIKALKEDEPIDKLLSSLDASVTATAERTASEMLAPKEQVDSFFSYRERIDDGSTPYVRTGIRPLDKLLGGGMVQDGLYILAGRPGMGKTALGIAIAENVARTTGRVDYFSLEMSKEQIMARRLSALARVDSRLILMETLTDDENRKIAEAARIVGRTPLYTTDGKAQTVGRITSIARASRDVKLVVVDHFGLILKPGKRQDPDESREIAHALKRLAQSIGQPVLCLAQLNRENENRKDKQPILSDLRATGAMEEDADGVIFVHRPDYYRPDYERGQAQPERTEIILAKNRHGRTGKIDLSFWPEVNTFKPAWVD
ncbi:MAG: DnaB-like helicase C-terminal domain-containing protein [Dysosmobacter sp.]|nr:DnaB-like helicase C-terminal domain-containing protein [Dysosmobacter sp.]